MIPILFLLACIPVRLLYALLLSVAPPDRLLLASLPMLIPIVGFFTIIFFVPRDEGIEAPSGKIWWQSARPYHLFMWAWAFVLGAFFKSPRSGLVIGVDALAGLFIALIHHQILSLY